MRRQVERFVGWMVARPARVLLAGAILTVLGAWVTIRLPLLTSRKALIRADHPVVQRLDRFLEDFGAASDLILAVDDAPRPDLEAFDLALADRVSRLPGVLAVDSRVDAAFFLSHAWLLAPLDEVVKGRNAIRPVEALKDLPPPTPEGLMAAVEREVAKGVPAVDPSGVDLKAVTRALGIADLFLQEWERWVSEPRVPSGIAWDRLLADQPQARPLLQGNGFHATRDGRVLFLFVHSREPSESFDVIRPFLETVRAAAEALQAEWRAQGRAPPRVSMAGMPAVLYEEYTSIQRGTLFTVATAGILVLLVVLFVMRSARRALLVFLSMGMGALWNGLVTWATVGHMTMVTTAFNAVLFGLGVDYGIFLTSRIEEACREALPLRQAIVRGVADASPGVLTAGLATTGIFLALGTVEFTGFSELGIVAGTGVLVVLLSTFTMLPAGYALVTPRLRAPRAAGASPVRAPLRVPTFACAVAVALSFVAAGLGVWAGARIPFNYDVLAMLPASSPAARYSRIMLEESDLQPEVVILRPRDLAEARRMAAAAATLPTVGQVQSIVSLFPEDALQRAALARDIGTAVTASALHPFIRDLPPVALPPGGGGRLAALLQKAGGLLEEAQESVFQTGNRDLVAALERTRVRVGRLAEALRRDPDGAGERTRAFLDAGLATAREAGRVLAGWKDARPLVPEDLPPGLRTRFFGRNGSMAIYCSPKGSVYDLDFLDRLLRDLYAVDDQATGFPTSHQVMARMAVRSFWDGTLLSVLVAVLVLALALRGVRPFLVALGPLVVGEGWMLGTLWLVGLPFNYGSIIAVPLVMALALDYGVWYAARRREQAGIGPWAVLRATAGTIILAGLTVLAGLGAIAFASYRAISDLGVAVTLGLVSCLVAALLLSPAVAQLLDGRKP